MKRIQAIVLCAFFLSLFPATNLPANQRGIKVTAKTPSGKTIPLYSGSYALVIGNGDYTNGWDPLPGAMRDVKDVARALKENGFNVTLKTNLTRNAFRQAFGRFFHKYGSNKTNRLFFYYAGHGYTQKMYTGEDQGYLVMVDAPGPEKDPVGFDIASIDMQVVVTQAKKVKARHVLFMFDSCFSGAILNLRERVVPETISDSISLPVRQFITAGRANEPVPDHSIFKQAFLDLLEGRDKEPIPDGYITGEELGLYLKNKVPEYNPAQHPQYGKIKDIRLDKGDFVFALRMPSALKPPAPVQPSGVRDYDKIIQERNANRNKWNSWQKSMESALAKVERYDKSDALNAKEKAEAWEGLLASYGADNPYSMKDDAFRRKAAEKINHWKYKPPVKNKSNIANVGYVHDPRSRLYWVAGPDKDTNWYEAKSWVQSLNLDDEGWRMPTMDEVESLYNEGSGSRNMTSLLKTTGWWVWSGEIVGSSEAGIFNFSSGLRLWLDPHDSHSRRAFAVRSQKGSPKTSARYAKLLKGKIFVQTTPPNSRIRILNIGPKFYQGMELKPGRYHVEVSAPGYMTQKRWVKLSATRDETVSIQLKSIGLTAHTETEKLDAVALNKKAEGLCEKGKYSEAIKLLNKAIDLNPSFSLAYYSRGWVYYQLKKYSEAIRDLDKAIDLKPSRLFAFVMRGETYLNLKQYKRAISDFDKAIELDPGYAVAYSKRGDVYDVYLDQYSRAIQDYNKAIELNPDFAVAYHHRGNAYADLEQYSRAIQDYDKAIGLNPRYVFAYGDRGTAYISWGKLDQGCADWKKACDLGGDCSTLELAVKEGVCR